MKTINAPLELSPMSTAYDLIVQRKGALHAQTVQVRNAAEALRLGRERFPGRIRGVVCRDAQPAEPGEHS